MGIFLRFSCRDQAEVSVMWMSMLIDKPAKMNMETS